MGLFLLVFFPNQKLGEPVITQQMSNILARLALHQFRKLDRFHEHRKKLAKIYTEKLSTVAGIELRALNQDSDLAWLRFTIRTKKASELLNAAKKKGIYLGDWYQTVIAPGDVDMEKTGYRTVECPLAEALTSRSINLPTDRSIRAAEIERILVVINDYGRQINNK